MRRIESGEHLGRIVCSGELGQHVAGIDALGRDGQQRIDLGRHDAPAKAVLGVTQGGRREGAFERRQLFGIRARGGGVEVGRQIVRWPQAFESGVLEDIQNLEGIGSQSRLAVSASGDPHRLKAATAIEEVEILGELVGAAVGIGTVIGVLQLGLDHPRDVGPGRRNDDQRRLFHDRRGALVLSDGGKVQPDKGHTCQQ